MTRRPPVAPSPGPLEEYAARFDNLFRTRAQLYAALIARHGRLFGLDAEPRPTVVPESSPAYWRLSREGAVPPEAALSKPAPSLRRGVMVAKAALE